jgi:hypothetical protein
VYTREPKFLAPYSFGGPSTLYGMSIWLALCVMWPLFWETPFTSSHFLNRRIGSWPWHGLVYNTLSLESVIVLQRCADLHRNNMYREWHTCSAFFFFRSKSTLSHVMLTFPNWCRTFQCIRTTVIHTRRLPKNCRLKRQSHKVFPNAGKTYSDVTSL